MIAVFPVYDADAIRDEIGMPARHPIAHTAPPHRITMVYRQDIRGETIKGEWYVKGAPEELYEVDL